MPSLSNVAACCFWGLVACCCSPSATRAVEPAAPNVLIVITDEHNFRTLGCYRERLPKEQAEMWGEGVVVPTPHVDALARQGVVCTRAYATAPVCTPSRAAMITGRYPHATGAPANDLKLDRSIPTLADRLNRAGYRSGFIGKWHLGGAGKPEWAPEIDGGFEFKNFMFNRGHWKKLVLEDGRPAVGARQKGAPSYALQGADDQSFTTDFLTDRALDFLQSDQRSRKPFFLVVSYPDPHGPNTVRAPYDQRFGDLRFSPPRTYRTDVKPPRWMAAGGNHPVFRGAEMARYFGMVQCIDDNLGRIVKQLEDSGELDQTLILFTSDHGDLCYEHDRLNKGNPYEGSARVPLIVRYPGKIAAGQTYRQPMGTVDITPTIMGLLGLPADPQDQGRDLAADLAQADRAGQGLDKPPVTFLRNAGVSARWVAAVDARYKLILSTNDVPWLFDYQQDPDELLNFHRRPGAEGVAERLAGELREYGRRTQDPFLEQEQITKSVSELVGESRQP